MFNVYAINENGDGYVQEIGSYEDIDDIRIRIGMFEKDVVISIKYEESD